MIVIERTRSGQATVIRIRRGRLDRGAAAVEMAIVMPLLIAMIIGIIDFSRIFNAELQLSQAAREGVRMAALGFVTPTPQIRAQAAAPNPAWGSPLSTDNITVSPCPATPGPTDTAAVVVNYPFQGIIWPNGHGSATLSQKAVMRCGG